MDIPRLEISSSSSEISFDMTLDHCAANSPLPSGNVHGPVFSGFYLLQYCCSGYGEIEADGQIFRVNPGECIISFPGQIRIERADVKNPWTLSWLSINGNSVASFFSKLGITPQNPIIKHCEHSNIPIILEQIVEVANTVGPQRDFMLGAGLFNLFNEFSQRQAAKSNLLTHSPARDTYVAQASHFLDMNYSRTNITIKEVAETVGLNRSYLYEIFKEKLGISPQEYLTRLRINKAREFLLLPQTTVTSVSYSVGYEPSVFSKAFKRVTGMTPIEYKQKYSK